MKTHLLAVSIAFLLCACGPRTTADQATVPAPDPATPETVAADAPAEATPVAPSAATPFDPATTAATPATVPASNPEGDKAVNDAIDSSLGDHARYRPVILEFQSAVAAGDASRVAALVNYPLGVDIGGKNTVLKNEKEFVARYAEFMTPDISKAIVETKYSDLFVNYKGVMFGSGQAWINGICKDDKCKAFDVKVVTLQHGPE